MSLFLIEYTSTKQDPTDLDDLIRGISATLVEARNTADGSRSFAILDHDDEGIVFDAVGRLHPNADVSQVRLVGTPVEANGAGSGNFLVEWDIPDGVDMDTYLARKTEKAPLYDLVPQVQFLRTYVREDMEKCLCFYDAPCADDVLLAREAVDTPVDRLNELET